MKEEEYEQIRLGLLEKDIILIVGEVTAEMAEDTLDYLEILECRGSPDIEIRFRTPGGNLKAGLHIYDALRRYKGKKTGIVSTTAYSMGALLLQACDERICLPNSKVLIHDLLLSHLSIDEVVIPKRLSKLKDEYLSLQARLDQILVKRTGKSVTTIHRACLRNKSLTAEEALKLGLIDRIEGE